MSGSLPRKYFQKHMLEKKNYNKNLVFKKYVIHSI